MYNLLIVDDEIATVEGLSANPWETLGVDTVYKANSATEALQIINENPIDIVITDIRMPGKSGIELIKDIYSFNSRTKSILLSGYADFEYAKQAIQHRAFDYLLKPISDEELLLTVKKAIHAMEREIEQVNSYEQAIRTIEENKGLLGGDFVRELMEGRVFSSEQLEKKLDVLQIPIKLDDPFFLIMIRLESGFLDYEIPNESVLEYAVTNMAYEIFGDSFDFCKCRDKYGSIVMVMKDKKSIGLKYHEGSEWQPNAKIMVEKMATNLQEKVTRYLKGKISILLSNWGTFPYQVSTIYQSCVPGLLNTVDADESFLLLSEESNMTQQIDFLYEPPLLIHLFETSRWDLITEKVDQIFDELKVRKFTTKESKMEVFFVISNSFSYFANKKSRKLFSIIGSNFKQMIDIVQFGTLEQFREITFLILEQMKEDINSEVKGDMKSIIQQIQDYVQEQLEAELNVSLQEVANHVYLHPAYLSKIYKVKTGEGFSEYIHRTKMEKAANLLEHTNEKINRIATMSGFKEPSYFIRVFKKYFRVTPQEYRKR